MPGLLAGSAGSGDACGRDVGGGLARPRSRRGRGRPSEGVRPHAARPAPGAGAMGGSAGDVQAGAGAVPSLGNATAGRLQGARGRRGVLSETPGFLNEERVDEKPETTKERSGSRARWEEIGPSHTKSEWPECRYEKAEDRREGLRFSQRGPGSGGRRRAAGTGGAGRGAAERAGGSGQGEAGRARLGPGTWPDEAPLQEETNRERVRLARCDERQEAAMGSAGRSGSAATTRATSAQTDSAILADAERAPDTAREKRSRVTEKARLLGDGAVPCQVATRTSGRVQGTNAATSGP